MDSASLIDQSPAWKALLEHYETLSATPLDALFEQNPERGRQLKSEAAGIYFDYSKNLLTEQTLSLLNELANTAQLPTAIDALFNGVRINNTEDRPALHTTLRDPLSANHDEIFAFAEALREGSERGHTGKAFRDVVNIGIGGSDLGPHMVAKAFPELQASELRVHFAANIDSDALTAILGQCQTDTTLFLISSKSFSTLETLSNAEQARQWLLAAGCDKAQISAHFVAMTSQVDKALAWGVKPERIFPMDEGIGGRFSLWSSIGLPIVIALGSTAFKHLLTGAHNMDKHFRSAPFGENLPVLHGLLSIWSINFNQHHSRAVLPYIHRLSQLPSYLQQLSMESLGKRVTQSGQTCTYATGQLIWGSEGTNGQHSFHQLLLQGSETVPVDFITTAKAHCQPLQHQHLLANCLAQSRALMVGKSYQQAFNEARSQGLSSQSAAALAIHKTIPGNRPSNTLLLKEFTPATLGALLALYEHSVYVQSVIWGINAFDQWAVELGKTMSSTLFNAISQGDTEASLDADLDSSSKALSDYIQQND